VYDGKERNDRHSIQEQMKINESDRKRKENNRKKKIYT
jgi:hypothetical protein